MQSANTGEYSLFRLGQRWVEDTPEKVRNRSILWAGSLSANISRQFSLRAMTLTVLIRLENIIMTSLWHRYDIVLTSLWHHYDTSMTSLWHHYATEWHQLLTDFYLYICSLPSWWWSVGGRADLIIPSWRRCFSSTWVTTMIQTFLPESWAKLSMMKGIANIASDWYQYPWLHFKLLIYVSFLKSEIRLLSFRIKKI